MSWSDHEIKKHSNYENNSHEKMYLLVSKPILIQINRLMAFKSSGLSNRRRKQMAKQKRSPEQLKDDDDRTAPMGLFITAEAWRRSAMVLEETALWLAPAKIGHAQKPVQFAYSHALELYLKALLRTKHSIDAVEKFRHNIVRLVKEAEELGLVVTCVDRDLFRIMTDTNALIEMRYIRTGSKTVDEVVEIEKLRRTCKSVRDNVGGFLRQAGILVRLGEP